MPLLNKPIRLSDYIYHIKNVDHKADFNIHNVVDNVMMTFMSSGRTTRPRTICGAYVDRDHNYVYALHYEKYRARYVPALNKHGKPLTHKSQQMIAANQIRSHKVISKVQTMPGFWKVTVYRFPLILVSRFKQHKRHFDITLSLK